MKKNRVITAAAGLAVTVLALAGCSSDADATNEAHQGDHATSTSAAALPDDVTQTDVDFASMMIVHHEQAVEMSDIVLAKDGVDSRVVTFAQAIKAAQEPEIQQLQGWLETWGVDPAADHAGMGHDDGMVPADDIEALKAATGADASRLFLEQMIVHHEGAVDMAEAEIADGKYADAIAMANEIVAAQTAEIAAMQELLGSV